MQVHWGRLCLGRKTTPLAWFDDLNSAILQLYKDRCRLWSVQHWENTSAFTRTNRWPALFSVFVIAFHYGVLQTSLFPPGNLHTVCADRMYQSFIKYHNRVVYFEWNFQVLPWASCHPCSKYNRPLHRVFPTPLAYWCINEWGKWVVCDLGNGFSHNSQQDIIPSNVVWSSERLPRIIFDRNL